MDPMERAGEKRERITESHSAAKTTPETSTARGYRANAPSMGLALAPKDIPYKLDHRNGPRAAQRLAATTPLIDIKNTVIFHKQLLTATVLLCMNL